METKKCLYCGEEFKPMKNGKYCSKDCSKKDWRENINPEKYKETTKKYNDKYRAEHLEEIRRKDREANKTPKARFRKIKAGAKYRNYSFDLTFEQFMKFWNQSCHYCGDKIKGVGIDRVDNTIGYTIDNCVPCCIHYNRMKMEQSIEELIVRCKKILKHLK